MKPGARKSEQAKIYKLMLQGYDAEQISRQLQITEDCVAGFMEHFRTTKSLPKTAAFRDIKKNTPRNPNIGGRSASNQANLDKIAALEASAAAAEEDDDGLG